MEEKKRLPDSVPYIAYEEAAVIAERHIKRLIFALVFAIFLIFINNAIWLYAWMQYDYESTSTQTIDVDGKEGNANYIGNDGSIVNGENSSKNSTETKENQKK